MRAYAFALFACLPLSALAADLYEPKPGSPERTAIMDAMRVPVSRHIGKRVTFTGKVQVSGSWAAFQGGVAPSDGQVPQTDAADDLEFDFFALLRFDGAQWKVLHWGFAGDISVMQEAREKYPQAPRALFPYTE